MNNGIEHIGVVESIGKNDITVILQDMDSCGCCPAASICNTKENVTDTIVIPAPLPENYSLGEKVKVIISTGSHLQAIVKGIVFPCLILLLTVTSIYIISGNELYAALSGLVATAFYYSFLYLRRDRILNRLDFKAEKLGDG